MKSLRAPLAAALAAIGLMLPRPDTKPHHSAGTVLWITSAAKGLETQIRGVLLVSGKPMRVVSQRTPLVVQLNDSLVFAAFEPLEPGALLQLDYVGGDSIPATVRANRVMVGRSVGGVATAFVQGY